MNQAAQVDLLHQIIEYQSAHRPTSPALWWQGEASSFAELQNVVLRIAERLAASGSVGDRIAVLGWNSPAFLHLIYSASAAGKILVPLNARLAPAELAHQLQASGASLLFADRALLQPLMAHPEFPTHLKTICLGSELEAWLHSAKTATLPELPADQPAWILYTSGSTGRPKGAILNHRSLMAGLASAALARPVQSEDRYYYPFPLFHVSAHNVLLQHMYGASVILSRSFDAAETIKACRDLKVTSMSLAPTMIGLLLNHPTFNADDLRGVRTIGYGASAMPTDLLQRLLSETEVGLCQSYGMTELSGSVAFLTAADHQRAAMDTPALLQSVGRPLSTAKIALIDKDGNESAEGEIVVKARQCMSGYWNDPKATALAIEDGWLRTGDIGRIDDAGYLYIVDRKKDMILSGGENIASREIENVLRRHPAIADCAVIGLPEPKWGECACAVLCLAAEISEDELIAHCRASLARFKVPKQWVRTDRLPLNAAGKVDKPLLRRQLENPLNTNTEAEAETETPRYLS